MEVGTLYTNVKVEADRFHKTTADSSTWTREILLDQLLPAAILTRRYRTQTIPGGTMATTEVV